MSYMFSKCENLEQLPDISKWKTNNAIHMRSMFYKCEKIKNVIPNKFK